jgi:drug/metabolite transporter (DMT)-like permease
VGLILALVSAAAFATSGSLARSLLDLGWSPVAVVAVRMGGAFAILLVPCLLQLRRTGLPTPQQSGRMVAYGITAVAMAQVCFFSAVQYLSVGVALLLEYTAPVLLIGYFWVRDRRRPAYAVLVGAGLALVGLVFVLDVRNGLTLNPIGVLWGLAAAVGLAGYFILSADAGEDSVHPLVLTTAGTGVGALFVLAVGLTGFLPLSAATGSTTLAGAAVPWWLPLLLLITVAAALAYLIGILAVRRLGSSVASFVSLTEVIFAVVFAIVLVGQQPSGMQVIGGLLVLAGIAVVQRGSATQPAPERPAIDQVAVGQR